MPELPEVEAMRRGPGERALGRRIARVDLREAGLLHGAAADDLSAALEGRALCALRRHGKVLFARADDGPWLVMHFGMTGFLAAYGDESGEPEHARLVLAFADGGFLAWDCQRKFGWLELADDPEAYVRAQGLGPDALAIGEDAFDALLCGTRGMVKPALMDQEKIAGIGNVWSDEILFQAGIAPDRRADRLPAEARGRLFETMRRVLREAAEAGADPARLPGDWLRPHRDDDTCPRCGGPLERREVSGRTAHLCPRCQPPEEDDA
jgi:formamidopyrimidine-DNA glycosylase